MTTDRPRLSTTEAADRATALHEARRALEKRRGSSSPVTVGPSEVDPVDLLAVAEWIITGEAPWPVPEPEVTTATLALDERVARARREQPVIPTKAWALHAEPRKLGYVVRDGNGDRWMKVCEHPHRGCNAWQKVRVNDEGVAIGLVPSGRIFWDDLPRPVVPA